MDRVCDSPESVEAWVCRENIKRFEVYLALAASAERAALCRELLDREERKLAGLLART